MFGVGYLNTDLLNDLFNWNLNHIAFATTCGILFGLMELAKPEGAGFFVNEPKSKQEKIELKKKRQEFYSIYKEQNGVGIFQSLFFPCIAWIGGFIYLLSTDVGLFWSFCISTIGAGFLASSAQKEGQKELSKKANLKILQEGIK